MKSETFIATLAAIKDLDRRIIAIYGILYKYAMSPGEDIAHKNYIKNYLITNMFYKEEKHTDGEPRFLSKL